MSVLCIAHRGGAALWPENTLRAFEQAAALGADGAELDVQLTRDGEVVVVHNFCLAPDLCRDAAGAWLTSPAPAISTLTFAELARFDVGRARPDSAYARAHARMTPCDGERIPRLADVIDAVREVQGFRLFVELKTSAADLAGTASVRLAEAVIGVLRAECFLARSVLVGFDWRGLLRAKELEPEICCWFSTRPQSWFGDANPPQADDPPSAPLRAVLRHWASSGTSPWAAGYDAVNHGGSYPAAIGAAGGDGWFPYWRDASGEATGDAHARGLQVGAWTVDDPDDMRALANLGIDALCTDCPDVLCDMRNTAG